MSEVKKVEPEEDYTETFALTLSLRIPDSDEDHQVRIRVDYNDPGAALAALYQIGRPSAIANIAGQLAGEYENLNDE